MMIYDDVGDTDDDDDAEMLPGLQPFMASVIVIPSHKCFKRVSVWYFTRQSISRKVVNKHGI